MKKNEQSISHSLSRLESIVEWFDEQEQVDVEEGLKRVREGAVLIKDLKARLKDVENEFKEVKEELETDGQA